MQPSGFVLPGLYQIQHRELPLHVLHASVEGSGGYNEWEISPTRITLSCGVGGSFLYHTFWAREVDLDVCLIICPLLSILQRDVDADAPDGDA